MKLIQMNEDKYKENYLKVYARGFNEGAKKQYKADIKDFEECNANIKKYKWTSCDKELPKEIYDSYWVCTDSGFQCECRWTNINPFWSNLTTAWHWNIFDIPQYSKVVAWMPLPEPYMEAYMVDMSEEEE